MRCHDVSLQYTAPLALTSDCIERTDTQRYYQNSTETLPKDDEISIFFGFHLVGYSNTRGYSDFDLPIFHPKIPPPNENAKSVEVIVNAGLSHFAVKLLSRLFRNTHGRSRTAAFF